MKKITSLISAIKLDLSITTDLIFFEVVNEYVGMAQPQSSITVAEVGLLPLIIRKGMLKCSLLPSL